MKRLLLPLLVVGLFLALAGGLIDAGGLNFALTCMLGLGLLGLGWWCRGPEDRGEAKHDREAPRG